MNRTEADSPHRKRQDEATRTQGPAETRDEWAIRTLLPVSPAEAADQSREGCLRIAVLLKRALRSERRRGASGHWSYDLQRHLALMRALKVEEALARRPARRMPPAR